MPYLKTQLFCSRQPHLNMNWIHWIVYFEELLDPGHAHFCHPKVISNTLWQSKKPFVSTILRHLLFWHSPNLTRGGFLAFHRMHAGIGSIKAHIPQSPHPTKSTWIGKGKKKKKVWLQPSFETMVYPPISKVMECRCCKIGLKKPWWWSRGWTWLIQNVWMTCKISFIPKGKL